MGGRRQGGFSLIELLITLAVIALMIGVGVPMYGTFTQGSAISGTTSDLVAALHESRSRAVSERSAVRLVAINENWAKGWQSIRVSDDQLLFNAGRKDDGSVRVNETGGATEVVFDSEGRSAAHAFTVELSTPGDGPERQINISPLGRIEVLTAIDGP